MTKKTRLYNGRKTVISTNGAEQLQVKTTEIRTFFNTIHKNKLKKN